MVGRGWANAFVNQKARPAATPEATTVIHFDMGLVWSGLVWSGLVRSGRTPHDGVVIGTLWLWRAFECITMAFDMGEVPMLAVFAVDELSPPLALMDCRPRAADEGRSFPRSAFAKSLLPR